MAFQNRGFTFFYSLVDNDGQVSTLRFDANSADYATALLDVEVVRNALQAITTSTLRSYGITDTWDEDAFAFPPVGTQNSDKASITLLLEGGVKKANIRIPAPEIGIFTANAGPGAAVVDASDPDLNTFVDLFKTTGGKLFISDGETVSDTDAIQSGKRISAKNNGPR